MHVSFILATRTQQAALYLAVTSETPVIGPAVNVDLALRLQETRASTF